MQRHNKNIDQDNNQHHSNLTKLSFGGLLEHNGILFKGWVKLLNYRTIAGWILASLDKK